MSYIFSNDIRSYLANSELTVKGKGRRIQTREKRVEEYQMLPILTALRAPRSSTRFSRAQIPLFLPFLAPAMQTIKDRALYVNNIFQQYLVYYAPFCKEIICFGSGLKVLPCVQPVWELVSSCFNWLTVFLFRVTATR